MSVLVGVVVIEVISRLELLVVTQRMDAHVQVAKTRIVGQGDGERWRLAAGVALAVEEVSHGAQMRRVVGERLGDGRLEGGGAVGIEESDEAAGQGAEVDAALGAGGEQRLGAGCCLARSFTARFPVCLTAVGVGFRALAHR